MEPTYNPNILVAGPQAAPPVFMSQDYVQMAQPKADMGARRRRRARRRR